MRTDLLRVYCTLNHNSTGVDEKHFLKVVKEVLFTVISFLVLLEVRASFLIVYRAMLVVRQFQLECP